MDGCFEPVSTHLTSSKLKVRSEMWGIHILLLLHTCLHAHTSRKTGLLLSLWSWPNSETFILVVPGVAVAGTGACKSLLQFSAPLLPYFETSAKQKTAVCYFPVCHRRCIASIWLAHCGISSSNVCTLLEIFLLKIIVLFFQFPIHLCYKVNRSFLRSQLHGYLSPDRDLVIQWWWPVLFVRGFFYRPRRITLASVPDMHFYSGFHRGN